MIHSVLMVDEAVCDVCGESADLEGLGEPVLDADSYIVADYLQECGWLVHDNGYCICPECVERGCHFEDGKIVRGEE